MKFIIEQLAIYPPDPQAAKKLLEQMGAVSWIKDNVHARGEVFGQAGQNKGELAFNYQMGSKHELEFEILAYNEGPNWMDLRPNADPHRVSHLGMHVSAAQLGRWREFFENRGIGIAQEVNTVSHTNPTIAGKRWYQYVIFDTHRILGVDLKFIVRREAPFYSESSEDGKEAKDP